MEIFQKYKLYLLYGELNFGLSLADVFDDRKLTENE